MPSQSKKRYLALLAACLAVIAVFWFLAPKPVADDSTPTPQGQNRTVLNPPPPSAAPDAATPLPPVPKIETKPASASTGQDRFPAAASVLTPAERSTLADPLGRADGDTRRDLRVLREIFEAYDVSFNAHPTGLHEEITAALTGHNPQGLAFIPADHPALDSQGRLLDRWGTPFFFHSISRHLTELRSAGPDRQMWTDDDFIWPESPVHEP